MSLAGLSIPPELEANEQEPKHQKGGQTRDFVLAPGTRCIWLGRMHWRCMRVREMPPCKVSTTLIWPQHRWAPSAPADTPNCCARTHQRLQIASRRIFTVTACARVHEHTHTTLTPSHLHTSQSRAGTGTGHRLGHCTSTLQ